jgi:hypothetical protein
MTTDHDDFGDDLSFTHLNPRPGCAGTWIAGQVAGHRFEALVFRDHAENPDFELGTSRISKLWVQRLADRATVVNFDRGWDVRPTDDLAARIADFLAAGLAEHVFGS